MQRSLASYRLLLKWQYLRMRTFLPTLIIIQTLLGVGIVYGFALLLPHVDKTSALYFATGAPTLGLIMLGLTIVPQEVSQAKLNGRHEYIATLPVPRLASLAADVTWWLLVQIPGIVLTLVVAELRFHIHLQPAWSVVPAIALVGLAGASVGYAIASLLSPQIAQQISNFVSIGALLFSPITFPAARLPSVLRALHRVLPIQYMADVMRGSLTGVYAESAVVAFAVVTAWCLAGLAVSYRAAVRRR